MGVSIAWLAVRGLPEDTVLQRLALASTDESADFADADLVGGPLPGGWFLVVVQGCDSPLIAPPRLAALSEGAEVVACSLEEHVMACTTERWERGRRTWRVEHDAQRAFDHLDVTGEPPDDLAVMRERHAPQQAAEGGVKAGVDFFFEIPLDLAEARTGYRHDMPSPGESAAQARVLADLDHGGLPVRRKAWWRFWAD